MGLNITQLTADITWMRAFLLVETLHPWGMGRGQGGTGGDQRRLLGDDFYAAPKLSPNGQQLAYISWNHPSMPCDCTELSVATLKDDGAVDTKDCDG